VTTEAPAQPSAAAADAAATPEAAEPAPTEIASIAPDPVESLPSSYTPAPKEIGNEALREAADGGDPKAMFEIGSRYAEGRGVKSDMPAAADWYRRAAELGYAPAQYRLGNFYEKGLGVGRDIPKARDWYEKAAKEGNASAMHNLAVLYAMGPDGKVDNDKAARWFLEAAELGVKDSQYNLGILAAKGAGMPQSLEESYKWFALVAKTGDSDAAAKRDEVAKALRPEQLAKAKGAVELWKAREVDPEANVVDIPEEWTTGTQTASLDVKQAVLNIQTILNKNGYDAGPADGMMGQKTRSAIMAFQADNGMDMDGEISEPLVKALLARK
jgi:localization factor PodJL